MAGMGQEEPLPARRLSGREGSGAVGFGGNVGFCTSPTICGPVDGLVGPTSDAHANWVRIVILNFAEFTSHTLAIAGAEMLMGLAKTGLGLCAADRNDARRGRRGVRRTGQLLQPIGELLLQICCRCSYDRIA